MDRSAGVNNALSTFCGDGVLLGNIFVGELYSTIFNRILPLCTVVH
jgi:hypothetical protein